MLKLNIEFIYISNKIKYTKILFFFYRYMDKKLSCEYTY